MPQPNPLPLRPALIGPLALTIAAATMIWWTWGYHTEPLVDFGREIYVAWRLAAGDVLYRDIDYFNGPLSPYFNSLIFRLFGSTLLILQIANLIEWATICALSYRLYVEISDRLAAFVAVLLFIVLFSFLQLNSTPIFNYVDPYAHEITQSLLASFGMFALLQNYFRKRSDLLLAATGGLLGLIFLMKVEVTLAAGVALAVAMAMDLRSRRTGVGRWAKSVGIVLGAALIPSIIAWLALCCGMPAGQAMRGVLGSWKYLRDPRLTDNHFYRGLNGMDRPWLNIRIMLNVLLAAVIILLPPLIAGWWLRRKSTSMEKRRVVMAGSVLYVAMWTWIWWDNIHWEVAARPLNVLSITFVVAFMIIAIIRWKEWPPRLILQTSFAVFALIMLGKLFLKTAINHYGFVLTVPAMAMFSMLVVGWLPSAISRQGRSGWIFRAAAMMLLAAFCARNIKFYTEFFRPHLTETMGQGTNEFSVNFRAVALNEIIDIFQQRAAPHDTLAVVPQGAMLNFLTHRINPTGELVLLPGEVDMFGENRIAERFADHPPDWIILSPTDVTEFGYKGFGIDYANQIAAFITANYRDVTPADFAAKYPLRLLRVGRVVTRVAGSR